MSQTFSQNICHLKRHRFLGNNSRKRQTVFFNGNKDAALHYWYLFSHEKRIIHSFFLPLAKQESFAAENEDSEPEEEGEGLHEDDKEEEHDFSPIQEIPHGNKKGGGKSKKPRKKRKK